MKVSMIGTGYVGLVSGICFAEIGHSITCIDIDEKKVEMLMKGVSPIYEPGLSEMILRNIESERVHFSTNYDSVKEADAVFLAVGTPSLPNGEANLQYLFSAAEMVAENIKDGAIVVIKSTVPVGTCKKVREVVASKTNKEFHIVNNPEFLKEGTAIEDFMRPDRVVIGHSNDEAAEVMEDLYAPLLRQGNPLIKMSNISAEMTKYAANCFLATKISFVNDIARLCDRLGGDIEEVRKGIGSDRRVGPHFLYPGPGYGGSCFPKDVKALIQTAKQNDMELQVVSAAEVVNEEQKLYMFNKINIHYKGDLSGKTFGFWGVAFKANTDDIREAPAISMAKSLIKAGAKVNFYDPEASNNFEALMAKDELTKDSAKKFDDPYECLKGTDGLVVMTEWRQFNGPDFNYLASVLKEKVIFDARNLYRAKSVKKAGLDYYGIGKFVG